MFKKDKSLKFLPVNEPNITDSDILEVTNTMKAGWISSEGPQVKLFEGNLAKKFNRQYAVCVANGSAALDIAVESLDIKAGDEVILPNFTIISCLLPILRKGAIPVFVDCDKRTFNCDANDILNAITKKTKAILIVHIYGLAVDIQPIIDFCQPLGIKVIEDAAEAIGLNINNQPCGSFGDISTFSFYPNKTITTGEGGAVLVNDSEFAKRAERLRNLSFSSQRFIHNEFGWNYRLTSIQAALGNSQLMRIDQHISKKQQIGKIYNDLLCDTPSIKLPEEKNNVSENNYWVYPILLKGKYAGKSKQLRDALQKKGIGTRPFFYPLSKQPLLNGFDYRVFNGDKNTTDIYQSGLYIPSGITLEKNEQEYVANSLREIMYNGL